MQKICKISLLFLLIALPVNGQVIINEICWMGTKNSANNEWLELFNKGKDSLNLDGWILKADDKVPEIKLSGQIAGQSFYLLERTDEQTLPEITADQIYRGALENNGENLKLYDNFNNLIDEVNCQDNWLAGDNKTKQTMERMENGSWQTSQESGGTPKKENSQPEILASKKTDSPINFGEVGPSPTPPTDQTPPLVSAATISFFSGLIVLLLKKGLKKN